ncbi:hypothetical protein PALB_11090 [Pseudoalteromonas luteoviolacea B = ATCC 29581]|nr:hypothetical protein PALB_11090 [Pseudoalteromonas luteoviolacea B = ATCC 29581]
MLKMMKKLAVAKRSVKFTGQAAMMSDKVISTNETLGKISGGAPRYIPIPQKDET